MPTTLPLVCRPLCLLFSCLVGVAGAVGSVQLRLSLAHDAFEEGKVLSTTAPVAAVGSNLGASRQTGEPEVAGGGQDTGSIWYRFSPSVAGNYQVCWMLAVCVHGCVSEEGCVCGWVWVCVWVCGCLCVWVSSVRQLRATTRCAGCWLCVGV